MADFDQIKQWLTTRQTAYKSVFKSRFGPVVLGDLARFCRATEPTFHTNERMSAILEGRREVWLRIQKHLNLSEADLFALTTGQPANPRGSTTKRIEE